MSGISALLNIAKDALLSQRYAIDVVSHNIANVDTEGYSRQRVELQAKDAITYGGLLLGSGVEIAGVTRIADKFIEARIADRKSDSTSLEVAENYMAILEAIFSETSENGLSAHLAEFWNAWHDLSNNPSGDPERTVLYEKSMLLDEAFKNIDTDLGQFVAELNQLIISGVEKINSITASIADLNNQIVGLETGKVANDLRDRRNVLLNQLSEYIGNKWFEEENGSVTVITGRGHVLVSRDESNAMSIESSRVKLETSGDSSADLTDAITGGKLGGWLDIKDEIVPKIQADLDALVKSFIGEVNKIHSQGAGLSFFDSAITGTYVTDATGLLDTLDFGQEIDYAKDLTIWVNDNNGTADTIDDVLNSVTVDMGISSPTTPVIAGASGFADKVYTFTVTSSDNPTVGVGNPQTLQWERFDTSGNWEATGTVNVNGAGNYAVQGAMQLTLADGDTLVEGNTFTVNTDGGGNPDPLSATVSGTANSALDSYIFTVSGGGGTIGTDAITVDWHNTINSGTIEIPVAGGAVTVDGMTLNFASGTLVGGDAFVITTDVNKNATLKPSSDWHWTITSLADQINREITNAGLTGLTASVTGNALTLTPDSANYTYAFSDDGSNILAALGINTFFQGDDANSIAINGVIDDTDNIAATKIDATGNLAVGDNSNALNIADLQYKEVSIQRWIYNRGSAPTSQDASSTLEDYYYTLVSSIGIKSESITRGREFNESIVYKLTEVRNGISAVSLDEELANLIKFQHAYVAAAKLIGVADEMLTILMDVK